MEAFLLAMVAAGYEVKHGRGGVISFRIEGQENYTRLRSSTLGEGYGQEDIQAIIESRAPLPTRRGREGSPQGTPGRVNVELKAATVDYAKTRPVFNGYKAA